MIPHVGPIDPAAPVRIDVSCDSGHAVAFALWHRPPNTDEWKKFGEGRTGDGPDAAHTATIETAPHSQIYYWVAVSSPARPHAAYHARITLTQRAAPVPHGSIDLRGTTDAAGNDSVEQWLDLV
ncbi:MAG TPA: hypothetical protein VN607_07925 [Gemmatimonadaceae bacterium]|nr:hypothetical protein [Gemmatimonadaceae bacterium]